MRTVRRRVAPPADGDNESPAFLPDSGRRLRRSPHLPGSRIGAVLAQAPGLDIVDDPKANVYPLPLNVAERDNCQVGRLRKDCALDNGLAFWVVGDQLLKGAALNAVQIAELLNGANR